MSARVRIGTVEGRRERILSFLGRTRREHTASELASYALTSQVKVGLVTPELEQLVAAGVLLTSSRPNAYGRPLTYYRLAAADPAGVSS